MGASAATNRIFGACDWDHHGQLSYLQDRVDLAGGGQPLIGLLPVARDGAEQRAGLELDALLVDEELLHAAVDRVHEEIRDPRRASQGILLGSLCARSVRACVARSKMGLVICPITKSTTAMASGRARGGVPVCWRWRRDWRWC